MPGDLIAQMAGLASDSEHRQILRMFANTIIYSIVGILAVLPFVL